MADGMQSRANTAPTLNAAFTTVVTSPIPGQEDVLDYQEKFDRMAVERIIAEDPEATYFYNARKNIFQTRMKVRDV